MSENWFETEYGELDEETGSSGGSRQRRVWLPVNAETKIVFLDGVPFKFWEHQVPIDGDFRNWFTCLRNLDKEGCPLCDYSEKHRDAKGKATHGRYLVGMFNVIDRGEWTDNDGNKHKDELKILPVKITMLKRFKKKADRYGGSLEGHEFIVSRTGKKMANIGDDWEHTEEVDLKQFKVDKFDFKEMFKPMAHADLLKVAKGLGSDEAEVASSPEDDDGSIPF